MVFIPTKEEVQAEVANLATLGITPNQSKHLVLCPLVERIKAVNGQEIDRGQKYVEEATKDLHLFFPVVAVATVVKENSQIQVGSGVFSAGSKRFITIPRDQIAPVLPNAVYALVEDYDCDLVSNPAE